MRIRLVAANAVKTAVRFAKRRQRIPFHRLERGWPLLGTDEVELVRSIHGASASAQVVHFSGRLKRRPRKRAVHVRQRPALLHRHVQRRPVQKLNTASEVSLAVIPPVVLRARFYVHVQTL